MTMRRLLVPLLALTLGAACAVLVACGAASNPHLLATSRAGRISADLDSVSAAVSSADCGAARRAIRQLRVEVRNLPSTTDPRLRTRLTDGVAHVAQLAVTSCHPQTTTTTTPAQTTTTTTTPTTTATTDTTPTTTTTTTPTTTTTTTPRPTPTTPTHTTTSPPSTNGGTTVPKSGGSGAPKASAGSGG